MPRREKRQDDKSVLELLEEAFHLVRLIGGAALASYYLGTLPFVLGALYFWADMSRSPLASGRLVGAAGAMAVLFVWMKCWHSVYMRCLLAHLCGEPGPTWTLRRAGRLAVTQASVQPWGLLALPAATVALGLPLPWAYGFFQNASVFGDGADRASVRATLAAAWRQAAVRPAQNMLTMTVLGLLAMFVFLNLMQGILMPAWALKTFFGVDTIFSRGGFNPMNTTFLATTAALTYLAVDPLVKAVHTLRCFYGRSLKTAQDLRAELKRFVSARTTLRSSDATPLRSTSRGTAAGCLVLLAALGACPSRAARAEAPPARLAAESPASASRSEVPPEALDESIGRVIGRREYTWRMPRSRAQGGRSFLGSLLEAMRRWYRSLFEQRREFRRGMRETSPSSDGGAWIGSVQYLVYVLLAAAGAALLVMVWRLVRRRRSPAARERRGPAASAPDLAAESVAADDLPEGEWLDLAGQMMASGNRRLALRALYLASLAFLAEQGMIALAGFKSDRDYIREFRRRAHALPNQTAAFGRNVRLFGDTWYGMHDVTDAIVKDFAANHERIRAIGEG